MMSMVSAFEFDNVKRYDSNTRTATIKNAFGLPEFLGGGNIATAQLLTPLNYRVGLGEQYVWEMKIQGFKNYNDFIKTIDLYDKSDNMKEISRDFDLRKRETIQSPYPTYKCSDTISPNGTVMEDCIVNGTKYEDKEVWTKLEKVDFKKGDTLFVRMYTFVENGDHIEWIPTIAGERVEEWAEWTADLNVNLVSYWAMEDASGAIQDGTPNNNDLTANNAPTYQATGKVNFGLGFDGINNYLSSSDADLKPVHATLSFWIKSDDAAWDDFSQVGSGNDLRIFFPSGTTNFQAHWQTAGGNANTAEYSMGTITDWHYVEITYDGTTTRLLLDGINLENNTVISGDLTYDDGFVVATQAGFEGTRVLDGIVDELSLYSEASTQSQSTQRYNGGTGITYTADFNTDPTVTLISPVNTTNYTLSPQSIDFTCYGSDDINFTEMEFYLNGSLTQTNSSGLNNTNYIFQESLTDGEYNWSCIGNDNNSAQTQSEIWFVSVNTTPFIEFVAPTRIDFYNSSSAYIPVNVSLTEGNFQNVTFSFSNGTSYTFTDDTRFINYSFADGAYTYNVTIWTNTIKTNNTGNRNITIDTTPPQFDITYPTEINYTEVVNHFNYTLIEVHPDTCWYSTNTTINVTISCSENITGLVGEEGSNTWTIYANDTFGFENSTSVTFHQDTIKPKIQTAYPTNITYTTAQTEFNYTYVEINCDKVWFSNDTGLNNYSVQTCGNNWTDMVTVEGGNNWTVFINDTSGNENSSIVYFAVDTLDPVVNIIYPLNITYNTTVTQLNYTLVEANQDKCWYSIDEGVTNSTPISPDNFTGLTASEGLNTWTVYCNDTVGREGRDVISFTQDALQVILNSPLDGATALINPVTFNCSTEISNSVQIANVSLWTNKSGWANEGSIWNNDSVLYDNFNDNSINTSLWTVFEDAGTAGTATVDETNNRIEMASSGAGGGTYSQAFLDSDVGYSDYLKWDAVKLEGTDPSGHTNSVSIGGTVIVDEADANSAEDIYNDYATGTWELIKVNDTKHLLYQDGNPIREFNVDLSGTVRFRTKSRQAGSSSEHDIDNVYLQSKDRIVDFAISDSVLWNCRVCDTNGDCDFAAANRTVSLDPTIPTINITYPDGTVDYGAIGQSETLNWSVNDTNLDSCWYNYNGVNTTVTCSDNTTTFILEANNLNLTFYVNDSVGNENSTFVEWDYTYLENSRSFDNQSYQTQSETFTINVTGASSVTLFYDGTEHTTTKSGDEYTTTIQIPATQIGNSSVYWKFDGVQDSFTSYQNVSETVFTLCNATYATTFLNVSFKDESDLSVINASIPTSTFVYWLGDGTENKTLSLINNTDNFNYEFCATPNETLNVNSLIQYKQGTAYPQRVYTQTGAALTNTTTDITLYLLGVSDGLFVTFQVLNVAEQPISGVDVLATRVLDGSDTQVAQGTTDAAGSVTFWLNPDFQHTMTFTKTGLDTETLTIFPTQSAYTVSMGGGTVTEPDQTRGVSLTVRPQISFLLNDTTYNFNYTVGSGYWTLEKFGYTIIYSNGTEIDTQSSTASAGGVLSTIAGASNSSWIRMDYYYLINTTFTNASRIWYIQSTVGTEYSISHFFERFTLYIDAGLFGFDEFGKALISFLILVMVAGGLSFRYGINSEVAIMGIIFGLVLVLDVGLGLIPNPQLATEAGLENIVTIITGIILFGFLAKEELR